MKQILFILIIGGSSLSAVANENVRLWDNVAIENSADPKRSMSGDTFQIFLGSCFKSNHELPIPIQPDRMDVFVMESLVRSLASGTFNPDLPAGRTNTIFAHSEINQGQPLQDNLRVLDRFRSEITGVPEAMTPIMIDYLRGMLFGYLANYKKSAWRDDLGRELVNQSNGELKFDLKTFLTQKHVRSFYVDITKDPNSYRERFKKTMIKWRENIRQALEKAHQAVRQTNKNFVKACKDLLKA